MCTTLLNVIINNTFQWIYRWVQLIVTCKGTQIHTLDHSLICIWIHPHSLQMGLICSSRYSFLRRTGKLCNCLGGIDMGSRYLLLRRNSCVLQSCLVTKLSSCKCLFILKFSCICLNFERFFSLSSSASLCAGNRTNTCSFFCCTWKCRCKIWSLSLRLYWSKSSHRSCI